MTAATTDVEWAVTRSHHQQAIQDEDPDSYEPQNPNKTKESTTAPHDELKMINKQNFLKEEKKADAQLDLDMDQTLNDMLFMNATKKSAEQSERLTCLMLLSIFGEDEEEEDKDGLEGITSGKDAEEKSEMSTA